MSNLALILSDIRSTYNVGSLMRSADGFSVKHIFFAGYTPYPKLDNNDTRMPHIAEKVTRAIHKTALGAENTVKFSVYKNIKEAIESAKKQDYLIVALEQSPSSTPINKFSSGKDIAIILGNEVNGVARQTLQISDVILEIPMKGKKESFNVSASGAIAMYALLQRPK